MGIGDKIDKRIKGTIDRAKHFNVVRRGSKYEDGGYEYQISVEGINNMLIKVPKVKKGRYQIHIDFEIIKEQFDILYSLIRKNIDEKDIIKKKNICSITLPDTDNIFEHVIITLDKFIENNPYSGIEKINQNKRTSKDTTTDVYFKGELRIHGRKEILELSKNGNIANANLKISTKGSEEELKKTVNYDEYDGDDRPFENILNRSTMLGNRENKYSVKGQEHVYTPPENNPPKEYQGGPKRLNDGRAIICAMGDIISKSITHKLEGCNQQMLALPPAEFSSPNKDSQYSNPTEKMLEDIKNKIGLKNLPRK